jgi:hypothetical protein
MRAMGLPWLPAIPDAKIISHPTPMSSWSMMVLQTEELHMTSIVDPIEEKIATRIIDAALAKGWSISVYEGEGWAIKRSTDKKAILMEMASTDMDVLVFRDAAGNKLGTMDLIYGNGEDLVSDHTANADMEAMFKAAYPN